MKKMRIIMVVITMALVCLTGCGKQINLNKYVTVNVEGYDGYGHARVDFDEETFYKDYQKKLKLKKNSPYTESFLWLFGGDDIIDTMLSEFVIYSLDKQSHLSNGDQIALSWECNSGAWESLTGYKLSYKDQTIKVKDLKKVETFDAFENVEVVFEGIAPFGTASVINNDYGEAAGFYFYVKNDASLQNGDEVTVTLVVDAEELAEQGKRIPEKLYKSYLVSGLPEYLTDYNALPETEVKKLNDQAVALIKQNIEDLWNHPESLVSIEPIGHVVLVDHSDYFWSIYDYSNLFFLYEIHANQDGQDVKYFNYVNYKGLYPSGTNGWSYGELDYAHGESGFFWTKYNHEYVFNGLTYAGFGSLNEFYNAMIRDRLSNSTIETDIKFGE